MKYINTYLRSELEKILPLAAKARNGKLVTEIQAELARRDEIERKRRDWVHYPELNHS
jgi:hypothetical protein